MMPEKKQQMHLYMGRQFGLKEAIMNYQRAGLAAGDEVGDAKVAPVKNVKNMKRANETNRTS
jgi:hypothetical protein